MKKKTKKKLVEFGNMLLDKYNITKEVSHADLENFEHDRNVKHLNGIRKLMGAASIIINDPFLEASIKNHIQIQKEKVKPISYIVYNVKDIEYVGYGAYKITKNHLV